MSATTYPKCDAPRCGFPADVFTKFGARYCTGHSYLADPRPLDPDASDGWEQTREQEQKP